MLVLDGFPIATGFGLFLFGTGRPILAGIGIAALGFGLGLADTMKRLVLREPVVFADRSELFEVIRHPRFYLAFIGTGIMVAGGALILAVVLALAWAEPPLWAWTTGGTVVRLVIAATLGRLAFVLPSRLPLQPRLQSLYESWKPSRDPETDIARFGLLATVIMHATIARGERPARRAAAIARGLPSLPAGQGPIILWQAESFVDVGRLDPDLADRLPNLARLMDGARLRGRLSVPAWGANTIRTELAAVAGIGPDLLGLDRFNPYDAFARTALPSIATQARAAGYRTVCVHPYSRSFYARDTVMPCLGFDCFIGIEAFRGAELDGGYVTDMALARFVADLVAKEGPGLFVFAISIENHGPWDTMHDGRPPAVLPPAWAALSDAAQIGRWLRHIEATDAALSPLREAIERLGQGWLGFYGDHHPGLAGPFLAPGAADGRTDYFLWQAGGAPGETVDCAGEELPARWLSLMR
ncbi:LTA synthase family protein [Sphingomonas bacterium]|uniref:LTA synthase family protein n=1 Tax=Sphingomonas bacterium TaxID=1895847 RepID=UPI00157700C3|nr:LTA synthase family protein [Sphingomonas bacterium]